MEQRKELIARWKAGDETLAELCRQYGIARQTGYKWIRRYELDGDSGLEELSRAPQRSARAMPEPTSERILHVRREHRGGVRARSSPIWRAITRGAVGRRPAPSEPC